MRRAATWWPAVAARSASVLPERSCTASRVSDTVNSAMLTGRKGRVSSSRGITVASWVRERQNSPAEDRRPDGTRRPGARTEGRAMDIAGEKFDVIVVGAGNAATCAALSAREGGARVLALEVAPEHWRGGNSAFTGGAWRIVYHGFDDLARLIPDISGHELANVDVGTYTEEQ